MNMSRLHERGFALPTVVIASLVLFMVLVAAVGSSASVRVTLDTQYYQQLARDAAETGLARSYICLKDNDYISQWSDASPLRPNGTCTGVPVACTTPASCFVSSNSSLRTTFSVGEPIVSGGSGLASRQVKSIGKVELLKSDGTVWKTYTYTASSRVWAQVNFTNVVFGYSVSGAYFGAIAADGQFKTVGRNTYGLLGDGSTTNRTEPVLFNVPGNPKIVAGYSNFLSVGWNMFVKTEFGDVYGAGYNEYGQLGNGGMTTNVTTPVKFNLPAGVKARTVGAGGRITFVVGTDNNVYTAGYCTNGMLGTNYTITGCAHRSNPIRVALPTPTLSDPNTLPTDNIAIDAGSAFIRMQGGRVYGWGNGTHGELAQGTYQSSSVPIKIGTYGDAGQPKAIQVAFDGVTVFILDDAGNIKSAGWNQFGQSGSRLLEIRSGSYTLNKCINASGSTVSLITCNDSSAQQFVLQDIPAEGYYPGYGRLRNVSTGTCLAQNGGTTATGLTMATCVDSSYGSQEWEFFYDRRIYKTNTSYSLRRDSAGTTAYLGGSYSAIPEFQFIAANASLVSWEKHPTMTGKVIKLATDQSSLHVMTSTGEVWSTGLNNSGQAGYGGNNWSNQTPRQFLLPIGVKAVDLYQAYAVYGADPINDHRWQNLYVIGDNGKVYGAGSNYYGQLGKSPVTQYYNTPQELPVFGSTVRASKVQVGLGTAVIISKDGAVYTLGNNEHGQLGDGTTTNSSYPYAHKYTNILPMTQF
ncbi:hypothetical protein EOL96_02255 [Candidatus Saccharibacteria bacterium]|nr:hypothetical protein [Candidatus Saccharibacteria bacterium]